MVDLTSRQMPAWTPDRVANEKVQAGTSRWGVIVRIWRRALLAQELANLDDRDRADVGLPLRSKHWTEHLARLFMMR